MCGEKKDLQIKCFHCQALTTDIFVVFVNLGCFGF